LQEYRDLENLIDIGKSYVPVLGIHNYSTHEYMALGLFIEEIAAIKWRH
jgi:hypothetical protein